jgi:hypothetical protein
VAARQSDERSVCQWYLPRFCLSSADLTGAEKPAMDTCGLQSVTAEDTGAVRVGEWHSYAIADLDNPDISADGLNNPDGLVPHRATAVTNRFLTAVRPEVTAADSGANDADNSVDRFDQAGIGDVLDSNIAGVIEDGCTH